MITIKSSKELKAWKGFIERLEERYILGTVSLKNARDDLILIEQGLRVTMDDDELDTLLRHGAECVLNDVCTILQMLEEDSGSNRAIFSVIMAATAIGGMLYVFATTS